MNIKLIKLWDSLSSSFWFVPTLMVVAAILLSIATLSLDQAFKSEIIQTFGWTYTRGPAGSRAILSSVAGSMITVATTAFSITIVALQLASSQFGPRLLRNFMRDRGNQLVLGTFIATFVYCLLVLRTINGVNEHEFVPNISVTCGILLAIASLGVLIYFIHHAAESIQADNVIAGVGDELKEAIDRLFPKKLGRKPPEDQQQLKDQDIPAEFEQDACLVKSADSGYLQAIDDNRLMEIAHSHNLLIRLQHRPGNFVIQGSDLVMVWPGEKVNKKLAKKIKDAFIFGRQRTQQQDVEFVVNQLVEIAVRALSPGVNDPFTALRCIDHLGAGLSYLAEREIPSPYRYDEDNQLRVIAHPVTFAGMTDSAFNQIRQYGLSSVAVIIRLLDTITVIAPHTHDKSNRMALLRHAHMIQRGSQEVVTEECDRKDIEQRYQSAVRALEQH